MMRRVEVMKTMLVMAMARALVIQLLDETALSQEDIPLQDATHYPYLVLSVTYSQY